MSTIIDLAVGTVAGSLVAGGAIFLIPIRERGFWEIPRPLLIAGVALVALGLLLLTVGIIFIP